MKRFLLALAPVFLFGLASAQSNWKQMMHDPSVNFYTVCDSAEAYFANHPKGKGSGWKGYQRWKAAQEGYFYPTGDRSQADPYLVKKSYERLQNSLPTLKSSFSNGWRDLGPYDANNITSHYAPGIGRVEEFFVDASNTNNMYVVSRSGGLWSSHDEGATWHNSTDFLPGSGVNTLAVSPTNSDSLLINVRNPMNGASYGLYRSVDGGATVQPTAFNPSNLGWGGLGTNDQIYIVRYHPYVPGVVLVGTSEGLYRSTDNMQTWTQQMAGTRIIHMAFHPTNPNVIYFFDNDDTFTTSEQVLISNDMGLTGTASGTLTGNGNANLYVSTSPVCPNCLYVGSNNGVWKSLDQGATFTFMTNPNQACHGFAVSDVDTSHILYGYVDLEMSADGGQGFTQRTWWAQNQPDSTYVHADLRDAACVNGVFYVGTDGYFARSFDNGLSWERLNDGTGIREFYRGGLSQSNWQVWMAGSQDNGTTAHVPGSWLEWNGGDGMEAVVQPLNDFWMIGSWQYGTRNRTKDQAQSWHGVGTPQDGNWIAPMTLDPNHQMRIYHFVDSVFRSEEFGTGWEYRGSPNIGDIRHAAQAENNSDILMVAAGNNIYKSLDGGQTYLQITGLPGHSVSDIAFAPHDDNIIIITYNRWQFDGEKVFITLDQGNTWSNITGTLGDMPIQSVAIDHTDDHNIYLGAELGVYTKPLFGPSWSLYNANLPNVSVRELEIQWATNTIRAITWGRGMWEYTLVGRNDHPSIVYTIIDDKPTDVLPLDTVPQHVRSLISYDNTLTSVYLKWSVGSATYDSTIAMTNIIDSTWQTVTPIPAFVEGTNVYFKVYAVGSNNDTTETYKFHYKTRPACISNGNMSWQTAVTLVDFNGINNPTGKTQPYTDYRDTYSSSVAIGNDYDLTVNLNTDGNYTVHGMCWIDWNQNGFYDDPGEEYPLGSANNTPDGPTTLSPLTISVPASAGLGDVNMRISARFGSPATPCEVGYDGEVEDYKLIVNPACTPTSSSITANVCNSYTSPTGNYVWTVSGVYQDTFHNTSGCDSIVSVNLTVNSNQSEVLTTSACDSYSLNGQTYTTSGTYQQSLLTAAGCDSTLTIDLTVNPTYQENLTESACFEYDLNGQIFNATGQYTQTLTSVQGCDSVINLDLTISTFDLTLSNTATTITSNAVGTSYTWVDCDNGFAPVSNGSSQTYNATSNGNYAVILTNGICVDTSACVAITEVGLAENPLTAMSVYPNPVKNHLTIDLNQNFDQVVVEVHDAGGKLVKSLYERNANRLIFNWNYAPGVYFVTVTAQGWQRVVRVESVD